MSEPLSLFIPGLPVAQPRQRHTRTGHNYTPSTHPVQGFKYAIANAVRVLIETRHETLPWSSGPIYLIYKLLFPRPRALQWKKKPQLPLYHTQRPDLDNVAKAIKDALTGIVWVDDAQVALLSGCKWICGDEETPGVQLWISQLQEGASRDTAL